MGLGLLLSCATTRKAHELDLQLGKTDIPIVLQDKRLTYDGRLGLFALL